MRCRIWIVLGLWIACACVFADVPERPRFRMIGSAQGLPSTEINGLARDRAGYLWIATADGVARYDGVGMRVWRHEPDDPKGLPGNNVQALMVGADDRVWLAPEGGGISVLDAARQGFTHYRKATHPAIGSDDIWAFAEQGDAVWFGTYDGGLHRMDASGGIRRYTHEADGLPSNTVLALAFDAKGVLWIATDSGLARLQGGTVVPVVLPGEAAPSLVYSLTMLGDVLWVGSASGVWRRAADGRWSQPEWSPMFERPNAMNGIACDRQGGCWIASQRGLWRQHAGVIPVPVPVRVGSAAASRGVRALLLQPNGALWAPAPGQGLGFLRTDWRQVARYSSEDGLAGTMYRALAPARSGGFWLGGYNGALERLHADGRIERLDDDSLARLSGMKLASIAEDRGGRLWLGHRSSLIRIDTNGAIDEWTSGDASDALPEGQVDQIEIAPDGTLWLSAQGGGVQRRDPATGKLLLSLPAGEAHGLGAADTEALRVSPAGEVWVAGEMGAARLQPTTARFVVPDGLQGPRVFALAFDGEATLWLHRLTGLEQYRRDGDAWRLALRIGPDMGLPAVAANAIRVDQRHRVWVSTARGLFRWDPRRRNVQAIGGQDGAASQEFLDRMLVINQDGVLAAATTDGSILLADSEGADQPPATPALRIDSFSVRRGGRWIELPTQDAALSSTDREFLIGARLLAYDDPAGSRYWSRLQGFDSDWVALGSSGERVFTGLAPGRYVLRMRARDASGNAASEQSLVFRVPPPWWRTSWAWALYALLVLGTLGLVAWAYRGRLKRRHAWQLAEERRALAEQVSEAKSRFLATLGHEVRTPMTGVLGMSELLQGTQLDMKQRQHVDAIRRAGEHLLRLVNDALDLARIEAGKLELANADFALQGLLHEVAGLMAPVAERKGLVFVEHVGSEVAAYLHGDRTRVQQILLNLVGNAIKFTETGHVALETEALSPQGVRFIVEDSGPGMSKEQQSRLFRRFEQAEGVRTASRYGGSGLGLAISQELAAAMGGRIEVDSVPGRGTRFVVELPLPPAQGERAAAAAPTSAADAASLRLLLVEDDPIVAEAISGLLRTQGHRVTHVAHGLAALSEVATQLFDASLLDLDLPGMDGLALARMLRKQGVVAPLLAVTARSDADAEAQARDAGFDGFLRKPVSGAMLAQALDALRSG